ncbi:integrase core domain-containing protein [Streptomyces sp. NBC_01518]|uniref:integrase core domain-containing protein n=2 Tax=unclassified Streptomyces TaxID=2593676 RepID=UPI00386A283D
MPGRNIRVSGSPSIWTPPTSPPRPDRSVTPTTVNALMESTIGLYKTEQIKPRQPWKSLSQVGLATAEWVDWYNHRRLRGEIGHVPPVEHEANHYMESTKPQVTTII